MESGSNVSTKSGGTLADGDSGVCRSLCALECGKPDGKLCGVVARTLDGQGDVDCNVDLGLLGLDLDDNPDVDSE
jgi:hypothetical protein